MFIGRHALVGACRRICEPSLQVRDELLRIRRQIEHGTVFSDLLFIGVPIYQLHSIVAVVIAIGDIQIA
jgi:hypothetical protein